MRLLGVKNDRLKRWVANETSKELNGLPLQQKLAQLEEQITIILVGGGFGSDPALKFKKTGVHCCDYCGAELKDKVKHATVHLKKLIKLVAKQGWPKEAPAPVITLTPPPILNKDQSENPVYKAIVMLQQRAVALVTTGRVEADIIALKDFKMPDVDASLVGRVMNYWFMVTKPGRKQARKYAYTGIIKEAITRVETVRGEEVTVMTAICEWTEAGDGMEAGEHCSSVILLPQKYGMDSKDGWFVHDEHGEIAQLAAALSTVQASMQEHIMKEFTCMAPKSEL